MPATLAMLPSPPVARYTVWSVLRAAGAIAFFVAWGVVVYNAGLLLQAEWKLARVLQESNDFATLPRVHQRELEQVTRDKLTRAGYRRAQIAVVRIDTSHGPQLRVARVNVAASDVFPHWSHRLGLVAQRPIGATFRELPNPPASQSKWPFLWG